MPAMPAPIDSPIDEKEYPTRLIVNIYLLVGILLLIVSSLIEGDTLSRYLIGTLVEFILAGLALVAMRIEKLSPKRTARLHWPATQDILLAIAAAPGLWIVGVLLNIASMLILGYVAPVPPSQFPATLPEALALLLATLVAAPLCEELMFRGYVQRAYERRRIGVGIVVGSVIFALYHLRFQGVIAIIPVSLALSTMAWRTGSLLPGMALHMAYNAIASVLLVATSFLSVQAAGALTFSLVLLGLLATPLSFLALSLIWRRNTPPPSPAVSKPRTWFRWAWIIPLIGLASVYGYSAITEMVIGRFPEALASDLQELESPSAAWDQPEEWQYTIQNWLGDDIGAATCYREAVDTAYTLTCSAEHDGYDIAQQMPVLADWGISPPAEQTFPWWPNDLPKIAALWSAPPHSWRFNASWAKSGLMIRAIDVTSTGAEAEPETTIVYDRDANPAEVMVNQSQITTTLTLSDAYTLIAHEWPWRLSALPFEIAYAKYVPIVAIEETGTVNVYKAFINVQGGEPVWTPAGAFVAWKVVLSWEDATGREQQQTAWYTADEPHTLLKLNDGTISFVLASDNPVDH